MYRYTKKKNHRKVVAISALSLVLAIAVATTTYFFTQDQAGEDDIPVSTDHVSIPVISLPMQEELAKRPYHVEASIVLDFYGERESEVPNMTKFEGTYRANQGIDYACDDTEFDVLAIFSGEVIDVKEDPLFGHSCTIKSGELTITYQSLKDMRLTVGSEIKQGEAISLASANIYNKELGNHVHIVVEKNGIPIDPESIYGKSLAELK